MMSLQGQDLRILHRTDQDILRAGNLQPFVVALPAGRLHVLSDAGACGGITQALDQPGIAAVVDPRRNKRG